jgi:hypothetical protein
MISGVTIDRGTSGTAQLMIRGISTINGPKSPLVVVDNFPYEETLVISIPIWLKVLRY